MSRPLINESALIYGLSPQLVDNATVLSSYMPIVNATSVFAIVIVGATDTTVDVKIRQATDSSGTGVKDVTGAAVTQITATDDDKFVTIEVAPSKFDQDNGFDHAVLSVTAGDGTTGAYVAGFLINPDRHAPPTQVAAYLEAITLT